MLALKSKFGGLFGGVSKYKCSDIDLGLLDRSFSTFLQFVKSKRCMSRNIYLLELVKYVGCNIYYKKFWRNTSTPNLTSWPTKIHLKTFIILYNWLGENNYNSNDRYTWSCWWSYATNLSLWIMKVYLLINWWSTIVVFGAVKSGWPDFWAWTRLWNYRIEENRQIGII